MSNEQPPPAAGTGITHPKPPGRSEVSTAGLLAAMPLAVHLGITLELATAEEVIAHLPWRSQHCAAGGVLHGGSLMTLTDTAGAVCAFLGLPAGARNRYQQLVDEPVPSDPQQSGHRNIPIGSPGPQHRGRSHRPHR